VATEFHHEFTSDLVTPRTHARIMRDINRDTGEYVRDTIVPRKFTRQAYLEYPDVVRRRTKKYAERKTRQVGHDIPNVLTGRMRDEVPARSRVTATQHGGRVYIRNYFPMRESTRQELEVMNKRDRDRIRARALRMYEKETNRPENRRKRRRKGRG